MKRGAALRVRADAVALRMLLPAGVPVMAAVLFGVLAFGHGLAHAQVTQTQATAASQVGATQPRRAVCAPTAKDYPVASLRAGEQGRTRLGFSVLATGELRAAWVVQSSGFARLDHAAMQILKSCRLPVEKATASGDAMQASYTLDFDWSFE